MQSKDKRPEGKGWCWSEENQKWFRVRKLTPKECFRLMGMDDEHIDVLLASGISNTQLYKLAGNSIVEDCLCEIFRNLLHSTPEPERDGVRPKEVVRTRRLKQLLLF